MSESAQMQAEKLIEAMSSLRMGGRTSVQATTHHVLGTLGEHPHQELFEGDLGEICAVRPYVFYDLCPKSPMCEA